MFFFRKKRKLREKADAEAKNNEDKKKKMKSGVHVGMSGRDMFLFDDKMGTNEVCTYDSYCLISLVQNYQIMKKKTL